MTFESGAGNGREDPASRSGDVAAEGSLRRIERLVAGYGLVAALGWFAVGSAWGAAALTLMTAGSILALRGVEGFVRRLRVGPDGEPQGGGARLILPWTLLIAALGVAFVLGSRDNSHGILALVLGASLLPLALITEAVIQTVGALSPAGGDGSSARASGEETDPGAGGVRGERDLQAD